MTGTRPRQRAVTRDLTLVTRASIDEQSGGINGVGTHDCFPLGPLGVSNPNGHGRTRRHPVTHTRQDRDLVGLELLACTAPVSQTSACQDAAQVIGRDAQTRGQALYRGKQCGSVRFSGGHPSQHASQCPTRPTADARPLSRGERSGLRRRVPSRTQPRFGAKNVNDEA